jgi:hypothetical protein
MAIKKSITDTYSKPKPKPTKEPYVTSTKEPELQGGRTARIKADYKKAVKGGAAKAANKLVKPRTKDAAIVTGINMGTTKKIVVDPRTAEKKAMASRIITDKSKTAMRAKIAEMNAKKARTKKAK